MKQAMNDTNAILLAMRTTLYILAIFVFFIPLKYSLKQPMGESGNHKQSMPFTTAKLMTPHKVVIAKVNENDVASDQKSASYSSDTAEIIQN